MTHFQLCLLLAGLMWLGLIAIALLWMGDAAESGERVDQVMRDHYRPEDDQ